MTTGASSAPSSAAAAAVVPGDAVLTPFGAGVVVATYAAPDGVGGGDDASGRGPGEGSDEGPGAGPGAGGAPVPRWARVRIWREPGRSYASGALATVRLDDDDGGAGDRRARRIAAAPGAIVRVAGGSGGDAGGGEADATVAPASSSPPAVVPGGLYRILRHVPGEEEEDAFAAAPLDDPSSSSSSPSRAASAPPTSAPVLLRPSQIAACSSKFYPVLEDLVARGEEAWRTVEAASSAEMSTEVGEDLRKVAEGLSSATATKDSDGDDAVSGVLAETSRSAIREVDAHLDVLTSKAAAVDLAAGIDVATEGLSLPEAAEVRQVYDMLRDDDLSELFARGRDRLSELAGGAEIASERTRGALAAMGISLDDEGDDDGGAARMRREALASLDRILRVEVSDGDDVLDPALRLAATARVRFGEAYDALSRAAATDPRLSSIFADVSDRTRAWREATGRLAQTRTVGVFAEGGRRLRARAAGLLEDVAAGGSGFAGAGDLTRAFAEGDAALARLKTLEVGDAVRRRLFEAIELRSESRGGLDAVIAGSLAAVCGEGQRLGTEASGLLNVGVKDGVSDRVSEDSIHSLISKLQQSATSTMSETKETLVALLSHRSAHREAVLLRLERVFMDLESQLGKDMTAEEIAQLASGAGGTMALFEPVAKRAAEEIEAQLDAVEERMRASKNWSHKADKVMEQVRKIMRGELSLSDLLDMAAGYLDEDEVVSKGGSIIVKAEGILDDLEAATARLGEAGASGAGASSSLLEAVAKAGLTKDAVLRNVEGLDVDRVLDGAAGVATDEAARRELISSAGDTALDFLLKILPEMPVPPLDGVREGLVYHLSNLSMAGFKVKKEDIHIEIAGIRAAADEDGDEGEGKVDDRDSAEKPPRPQSRAAKASEILLIDIRNISATLDDAVWSFEQTYMPYLKGSGKANARLWDGDIRMSFELRRQKVEASSEASGGGDGEAWEPVLCLNDRSCSIGGVELLIQGTGRMAWAANKLANLLRNPLRDYVTAVIVNVLKNNSGWLIDMLNQNLAPYWDVILRTASLKLGDLPRLARHHVTKADPEERADEVELVWRERVPLGLNILTNDPSGLLKVIDLPRGTQARKVAQSRQLDPDIFKGATIVSVNGKRYGPEGQVDLFAALKDPSRPKSILFQLASSEDAEGAETAAGGDRSVPAKANGKANSANCVIEVVNIVEEGSLGLRFSGHSCLGLTVSGFCRDASDQPLPIEKSGRVATGYILSHVDDEVVLGEEGEGRRKALKLLEGASSRRPLRLGFVRPYMHEVLLKQEEANGPTFGGPSELVFVAEEGGIVLKDFALVDGASEAGGVLVGDNLAFINGIPVGAGCRLLSSKDPSPKLDDVLRILEEHEPLALTFARAQAKPSSAVKGYLTSSPLSLNVETARTFSIPAPDHTRLGCKFVTGMNGSDVVVREMGGVVGSFQRRMKALEDLRQPTLVGCRLASVDSEDLPSYATPQLISSTLKRTWAANGRLRLTFCDEAHKEALSRLKPLTDS